MFCPKCATQNLEGASFCRGCGANISLVPKALTGQLPELTEDSRDARRRRRRGREISLDHAFKNIFMGIAFFIVAIVLSRSIGRFWWFWLLLPAFSMMGTGIAQYIRLREQEKKNFRLSSENRQSLPTGRQYVQPTNLSAPNTEQLMPPVPSVTEGTTRHLGVETPGRHFEAEQK